METLRPLASALSSVQTPLDLEALSLPHHEGVLLWLADTLAMAERHHVVVRLDPTRRIPYANSQQIQVSGFFVDRPSPPMLAVATGKPFEDWFPVLVHEACHMRQWLENATAWTEVMIDGREATDVLDDWISGTLELEPHALSDAIARARTVELDCERRVVEAIDRYGLPIDREGYIRRANAYVLFYNHIAKTRAWYPSNNPPYENAAIIAAAPTFFPSDASLTPPSLSHAFEAAYPSAPAENRSTRPIIGSHGPG